MKNLTFALLLVPAVFVLPAALVAGGDPIADARAAARSGDGAKTGELLGEAVARAHRAGDLLAEQEAAEAWREILSKRRQMATGDALEAALLAKLDPKRCGAFFSAPVLAGDLLLESAATGECPDLPKHAAILRPFIKGGKSGTGLAVLARLASGMVEARGAAPDKGVEFLDSALKSAGEEGWADIGVAAGVELAALHLKQGREDAAAAAVGAFAALLTARSGNRLRNLATKAVEKRLAGAPEKVLAPWKSAQEYLSPATSSAGADGGAGADGASSPHPVSPLGEALKKLPAGRILATVERIDRGFELRVSWDPRFRGTLKEVEGTKYLDDGGLTVGLSDAGVALRMTDPRGLDGQPGASSEREEGLAWYRLARKETWNLSKDGVVTITAGR